MERPFTQPESGSVCAHPPVPCADGDGRPVRRHLGGRTERQQERVSKDISQAVEAVRGELDPEADELVRGWLDVQAQSDARFRAAWQSRHSDPVKWNRVLKGMADQFATKYGKRFGRSAEDDREAMAAAVRTAGRHSQPTMPSEGPNLAGMSDQEFAMYKARLR